MGPTGSTGPIGAMGPTGPTGPSSTMADSTLCFCEARLAYVIEQLLNKYPGNIFNVYTNTWFTGQGIPVSLYQSPDGTGPGLLILTDETGAFAALPLNNIVAITVGAGSIYDPSIEYLLPVLPFSPGCDTNVVTAIHDYLPVSEDTINVYSQVLLQSSGSVIKN